MSDITPDEMRGLARVAGLRLLDEDVEPLTLQFNALREALGVLDEHDLYGVAPLPALQYPAEAPGYASPSLQPSPSQGEGAGSGPSTGSGRAGEGAGSSGSTPSTSSGRAEPRLTESSDAPLAYKPITELAHLLRTRQVSSVELTRMYLDRIERFDGELRSYVTVTAEFALEQGDAGRRGAGAGRGGGAVDRHTAGAQGRVLHERHTDDVRLQHPVGVRAGLRRDAHRAVPRGGRGDARQAQHDGVRVAGDVGVSVRAAAQPVEPGARRGRVQHGLGHRGRGGAVRRVARRGHGRLDTASGVE